MSPLFHGFKKLKSGNLTLLYREGEIRQVCLGEVQVINAIYAAVRNQNWATIPFRIVQERVEEHQDGFTIEIDLKYEREEVQFRASITIDATGNRLSMGFKGSAESAFLRNRIGLCILHPIKECRGKTVHITHPDGTATEGRFPDYISPHQPFFNISGMRWNPAEGMAAELNFEGEIFEAEDQRNWTDASFKTYGTPLGKPFPVQVEKGESICQTVSLLVEQEAASDHTLHAGPSDSDIPENRILSFPPGKGFPLPGLGVARTTEDMPMTAEEAEILGSLPFHHYRTDLKLDRHGWDGVFDSAAREQQALGCPLELALHFGRHPDRELERFLDHYLLHPAAISHLLVFDQDSLSSSKLMNLVAPRLRAFFPDIQVGGGTDANFAELNRNPPDPAWLDFVCFSVCPQVHAFDKLTLLENLAAQPDSVRSAASLLTKPVSIGALTLKQRFNAVATDEGEASLIPESDPRQHTFFAAGWTLGSLINLAPAAPVSITYFETTGPRGILSRQLAPLTNSPLFHLFSELVTSGTLQLIPMVSSHPLEIEGLTMQNDQMGRVLIANHTEHEKQIHVSEIPGEFRSCSKLTDQGWIALEKAGSFCDKPVLEPLGIYKITYSV